MHSSQEVGATSDFRGLGIAPALLTILENLRFKNPTPIQARAIPRGIEGEDIIGIAQTGTGKTLAFGVPLIQRLAEGKGLGLILVPTRELASQVEEELARLTRPLSMRTCLLIGGASMNRQVESIRRNPDIVIATPGRLNDHLAQGTIRLSGVEAVVFDEADRMLDMGFWPQIKIILTALPEKKQTMLFSATLPSQILTMARTHMRSPVHIEVAPPGTTADKVSQEFFIVPKSDKPRLLEKVLNDYRGSAIVFTRTKHGAKRLRRAVAAFPERVAELHGNLSPSQRRDAMEGFKTGKYRVLIATDIASRGIDVRGIELVINYDLPMDSADYVHRIGRTARAGEKGHAISFAEPQQRREMREIERLVRKVLPVSRLPELPPARALPTVEHEEPRRPFRKMVYSKNEKRRYRR